MTKWLVTINAAIWQKRTMSKESFLNEKRRECMWEKGDKGWKLRNCRNNFFL